MSLSFRLAEAEDIPALVDIEARAFRRDTPAQRVAIAQDIERQLKSYVVLLRQRMPVACARVQRDWLRVGSCRVLKGDVGHVAVAPEWQGQGLGTALMHHLVDYMRAEGFHLSRLGGLMNFYARFGYEPFPRRYVHIPVPRLEEDLKGKSWAERLGVPDPHMQYVRLYHPTRDYGAVHRLRYEFNVQRSGALVMAAEPTAPESGDPDPDSLLFVYDEGAIRGWLQGGWGLVHAGDAAPSYRIDDLAYELCCPQAVGALVKTMIERAQRIAPTTLICRLPYDEALFAALTAANIPFDVVEMHCAVDGNMMRVINLTATLSAIAPELSARVQAGGFWEGRVRLVLPYESATLCVSRDGVCLAPEGESAEIEIVASQADFIKWLFGIIGFAEWPGAAGLAPAPRLMMSLLFPRMPCASGPWG